MSLKSVCVRCLEKWSVSLAFDVLPNPCATGGNGVAHKGMAVKDLKESRQRDHFKIVHCL